MSNIKFENLKHLLSDMEQKEWVIDLFSFIFKQKEYIVLLTRYLTDEPKPSEYAKAKVEFIDLENVDDSLEGYIDFWNVYFFNFQDFFRFFEIEKTNTNNNVLETFSETFAKYIPKEKIVHKNRNIERQLIARRVEGNDPNAIYCLVHLKIMKKTIQQTHYLFTHQVKQRKKLISIMK